jgi:hypothetical protein
MSVEKDSEGNIVTRIFPFKSKITKYGKMYRRKHGFVSEDVAAGDTVTIDLPVPYNNVKINEIEFINCLDGDTCNLQVLDTPTGTFSTIPNCMLNQFGFEVQLPNGPFKDHSDYDADLIKDMDVRLIYTNNSTVTRKVRGNIVWHEVKVNV